MNKNGLPTVGILGVGKIGLSVARRLLAAGHPVIGLSRDPLDEFVRLGGRVAESGQQIGQEADVVIDVLGSETGFETLVHGENGLVKAARPGQIVIALSSHHLEFKNAQKVRLAALGIRLVDATVSGSPNRIDDGQARVFVAGEKSLIDDCAPVLSVITPHWHLVGEFGAATRLKFVNNTLSFIHGLAAAEALALAVKMDLDPKKVVELLEHGTGGSAAFSFRGPKMAERRYPVTGDLRGATLVIDSILEMAEQVDADMPLMTRAADYFHRAVDQMGLSDEDVAQLFELLIPPRSKQA